VERHRVVGSGASTQEVVRYTPPTSTRPLDTLDVKLSPQSKSARRESQERRIDSAVYAHIRAVRTLGRTQVNTAEISKALGLPLREVEKAAARLMTKGVKLAE
jgi:hypothetical protein